MNPESLNQNAITHESKIKSILLLKYLILIILILLPLLLELNVFASDTPSKISISSDKNNYEEGETIQLTVRVSQHEWRSTLKVEILINGILVGIDEKTVDKNGEHTFEFLAQGPFLDEEGVLTARASLRDSIGTTQFNFKPRPAEISKQIIEKPIIVIENSTTNTEIIRIAPGSEILGCGTPVPCFFPNKITIEKGSQIRWENDGSTHTITGGTPNDGFSGTFDSGLITEDFIMNFDRSGVYPYYCTIHPWMQGLIIVETDTFNSPKVDLEAKQSNPLTTPSYSKGTISLSPPKVNPEPVIPKEDVSSSVSKYLSLSPPKVTVPKHTEDISSQDKSTPNNSGIVIVIVFVIIIFLIIYKFKKRTKNNNYKEERNRKENQWNKKRSEDHHRQQEEERRRWDREKDHQQQNKQKQYKQKQEKQETFSNKTEFSIAKSLEILDVNYNATPEMIKKAKKGMVLKYHPDKHPAPYQKKQAEIMMRDINIAYDTLQRAHRV